MLLLQWEKKRGKKHKDRQKKKGKNTPANPYHSNAPCMAFLPWECVLTNVRLLARLIISCHERRLSVEVSGKEAKKNSVLSVCVHRTASG